MRSAIFFFVVFTLMLGALYLFVETPDRPSVPAPSFGVAEGTEPTPAVSDDPAGDNQKNIIEFPVMDPEKGRLLWKIKGELPGGEYTPGGIRDPKKIALRNGVLQIPVYDDTAEGLPEGIRRITEVTLTFADMEYKKAEGSRELARLEETIRLFGGGEGRADDGTRITFEELVIKIQRRPSELHLSSTKKISITNDLLKMRSPNGMEASIRGGSDIERVTFRPPVVAFVNSKSAQLFSIDAPSSEASVEIAITSRGPLELDRTATPPRIRFQNDVKIFPVEDTAAPVIAKTWFHCQELSLLIRREDDKPAALSEAIASWDGGRVKASYEGIEIDGDLLTWKTLEPGTDEPVSTASEAVLTGRPQLHGDDLDLSAESVTFRLNERRIRLVHDVAGVLRRSAFEDENEDPVDTQYLPETWEFDTDDFVEIVFAADGKKDAAGPGNGDGAKKRDSKKKRREAPSEIERLVAESTRDDGLLLKGVGEEALSLQGRRLVYDGKSARASVTGGPEKDPTFRHGKSAGSAKEIILMLEERFLRFDTDVVFAIDKSDVRKFRDSRKGKGSDGEKSALEDSFDDSEFKGGVELRGDRLDVTYDEEEHVRTVVARGHPVSIVPLDEAVQYALRGPRITWDHAESIADIESVEEESKGAAAGRPTLDFGGGTATATSIRFVREDWTAELTGAVELRETVARFDDESESPANVIPVTRPDSFALRAGKARIVFFEEFEKLAPEDQCVKDSLRSIRQVYASADSGKKIDVQASEYSASASELEWDVAAQKMRLHGDGQQEFRRIADGHPDTVRAAEVVYDRAASVVRFERDVTGEFYLDAASLDGGFGRPTRASVRSSGRPTIESSQRSSGDTKEAILWKYSTDAVEFEVKDAVECRGLELVKLRAHGKVVVESSAERVKLLGDELVYNHDTREFRIFSDTGRPQTLVHEAATPAGGTMVNKIDSREIRVSYSTESQNGQEKQPSYVIVDFEKDVSASFHTPAGEKTSKFGEEWKLRAESLRVEIESENDVRRAIAEGKVIFTSDEMQANAPSARYKSVGRDRGELTLLGSASNPVRFQHEGATFSEKEIVIKMDKDRFTFHLPRAR